MRTGRRKEERMMKIEIEKGIPIPIAKGGNAAKIIPNIKALDVGDSFKAPKHYGTRVSMWERRTGFKLCLRVIDAETIRVWRTA
jgi:hypothetical protein